MKGRKNWPFAYQNIHDLLEELTPHLQKNRLTEPAPLGQQINPQVTVQQLGSCIDVLNTDKQQIQGNRGLEQKMTVMLIDRFISDASHFQKSLLDEMKAMGVQPDEGAD